MNEFNTGVLDDAMRESEERVAKEEAQGLGLAYIDLRYITYNPDIAEIAPYNMCKEYFSLPFLKKGKVVYLAIRNADKIQPLIDFILAKKLTVEFAYASESGINDALEKLKLASSVIVDNSVTTFIDENAEVDVIDSLNKISEKLKGVISKELLTNVLNSAVQVKASDIHLEPYRSTGKLRFRIDGVMEDVIDFDKDQIGEFTKQIKYQSGMILNRSDMPQDGRFEFSINKETDTKAKINARVSVMPSVHGESIVVRLLNQSDVMLTLDKVGMSEETYKFVNQSISQTKGMILVTGPTGSGKTSTLYAVINYLNDGKRKIITLEDPVEYRINGIVQSQIDHDNGYNFADGLRAILRHDPDIILLGEIRDEETAKIATQACLTGHLVLATLHTNSPSATITRMRNFGIEEYNIAPALNMILAQRLVRKICSKCATERDMNEEEIYFLKLKGIDYADKVKQPVGCDECNNTGYKGRIGIFAPLPITPTLRSAILNHESESEIENRIKNAHLPTLESNAFDLIKNKITTIDEIIRVIGLE